jgi:hypothetical protein
MPISNPTNDVGIGALHPNLADGLSTTAVISRAAVTFNGSRCVGGEQ